MVKRLWCPLFSSSQCSTQKADSILNAIHRELASPSTSADHRDDLEWVLAGYADEYCFDWLWEEPELRDHTENPFYKGKAALGLTVDDAAGPKTPPPK